MDLKKEETVCFLDLDDFGETNNRLDWLWMLKKEFPKFKINLFTIPNDFFGNFCAYIKSLDWIRVCIHGYFHVNNEEIAEKQLKELKDFFAPVYRAPYWQLSDKMYQLLKKLDYRIMLHPDDPREGIKYNWNIENSPPPLNVLYGHGHVQDYPFGIRGNGIIQALGNIMKLPKDTEFKFL